MASFFAPVSGKNNYSAAQSTKSRAAEAATWLVVVLAVVLLGVGVVYSASHDSQSGVPAAEPPAQSAPIGPVAPFDSSTPISPTPATMDPTPPAATAKVTSTPTTAAARPVTAAPTTTAPTTTTVPAVVPPTLPPVTELSVTEPPVTEPPTTETTDQFGNGPGGYEAPLAPTN